MYAEQRILTFIAPHSPSIDVARELVGIENYIYKCQNNWYGTIAITPEIRKSFRSERIAECLFGSDIVKCKNTLTIAGSRVQRKSTAWLADYFGLPTDFISQVQFWPHTSAFIINISCFFGLDYILPGLFFSAHVPWMHTRWSLSMRERIKQKGTNPHDAGYFSPYEIPRKQLVKNFISFISGKKVPKADSLLFHPLEHAKMSPCQRATSAFTEAFLSLGYIITCSSYYHLALALEGAIPAGTRPRGEFLFEPIAGNGHQAQLGILLSGHCNIWENTITDEHVAFHGALSISHLFKTCQQRSFDIRKKPNSRYMLAARVGIPIVQNIRGQNISSALVEPIAQFKYEVTPIANLTTFPISVKTPLQLDGILLLAYAKGPWDFLFGYGFWHRSCEKISIKGTIPLDKQQWVIKGDAHVIGFEQFSDSPAIALSISECKATINAGTNFPTTGAISTVDIVAGKQNLHIDNPLLAFADNNNDGIFNTVMTTAGGTDQIRTSVQPIILTRTHIDLCSGRTSSTAHKIVTHCNYTVNRPYGEPFVGFGTEVEFGTRACAKPVNEAPGCLNCAFSFWSIWLKGGFSFG